MRKKKTKEEAVRYARLLSAIPEQIARERGSAAAANDAMARREGAMLQSIVRERVLQLLALLNWGSRIRFLFKNPSLLLPYLTRIRRVDSRYRLELKPSSDPFKDLDTVPQRGSGDDVE